MKFAVNIVLTLLGILCVQGEAYGSDLVVGDFEDSLDAGWEVLSNTGFESYGYSTNGATLNQKSLEVIYSGYTGGVNTLKYKGQFDQMHTLVKDSVIAVDVSVDSSASDFEIQAIIQGNTDTPISWYAMGKRGVDVLDGSSVVTLQWTVDSVLADGIAAEDIRLNLFLQSYTNGAAAVVTFDNIRFLEPVVELYCSAAWDLAGDDCFVDMADLSAFSEKWMLATDGYDIIDVQSFSEEWLECQSPDCRPNVLFIAVDDLRPELRCYGNGQIVSPNIDRLGSQGVLFSNAYCQVAACGASRASVFTGARPNRNRFTEASTRADVDAPGAITLPELFKNNGYYTVSNGKVFHSVNDSADSWSEAAWRPIAGHYQLQENIDIEATYGKGPGYESADVADNAYRDGMLTEKAISDLGRLKDIEEPFFLAVGFFKPHLPFVAPKKYWDMYPESTVKLPDNYSIPSGAPAAAIHSWGELRAYYGMPETGPLSDDLARTMIRGYYSCTSYIDAQIGMILDELDALGLRDNTIVVLWSDHGWNLGEHTLWAKHCVFDTSLRVPLIVSAPGYPQDARTSSLVENVDLYPTLCELAGLDTPTGQLHGQSLVPILSDPTVSLKTEVYGRWKDADAIRTDQYLYSQWLDDSGTEYARMMYDHYVDPNETVNISEEAGLQGLIENVLNPKLDAIRLY